MRKILRSDERGRFDFGWLKTAHSFSFGEYYNPEQMGFRCLRVINEDYIEASAGFPTHRHRDMEIVTYVVEGALEHKDSLGNTAVIRPGEVQKMTAGTGVEHSEFNHSKDQTTHLLQIWILPQERNLEPSYEQKSFDEAFENQNFVLVGSSDGREGSIKIHQDTDIYVAKFSEGDEQYYTLKADRHLWVQMVSGSIDVNDARLHAGDGCALSGESDIRMTAISHAEFIIFDLP